MSFRTPLAGALACLLAAFLPSASTAQYNITELGRLSYQELRDSDLSNLWGYTDELGNEYAIMGVNGTGSQNPGGVSVVDVSDPANPHEIFFFAGPTSIWREIKVYGDHAYITTEAEGGGLTIVDLSPLPQSTDLHAEVWMAPDWETSHALFIDENGRLFVFGSSRGNGGAIMYDLTQDPFHPVEVGAYDQWYVHDGFARGDTLYAGHIYDGFFSIVDVSDPAVPVLLGTQTTPNAFTHNVWLDDAGDHLFTTDERTDSYVGSYNIDDPQDILFLDKLQSDPGSGSIPHNTYWLHHHVVTSYYTYGVVIYDATHPANLVEVGHYDTSPFQGDGFNGAWGVYPFFPSGNLIVSDIEEGLIVLGTDYRRACWLEGTVRNAVTTAGVYQATVTIVGPSEFGTSGLDGRYGTGYHEAGTYDVLVEAAGYIPQTVPGVVLVNGEVTMLDIDLQPLSSFVLQGTVTDAVNGDPIAGAQVRVKNDTYEFSTNSQSDGTFSFPAVFADSYAITAGRWGWRTACLDPQAIAEGSSPIAITLQPGYADDFELDLGWTVQNGAGSGAWVRGVPVGTEFQGSPSNPGTDVAGDCGGQAYITGNGGGDAGSDDVDDGHTILLSPTFDLTGMVNPHLRYSRWFVNVGGSGQPNDRLVIGLDNGTGTAVMEQVLATTPGNGTWHATDIDINDLITITPTLRLVVNVGDDEPGHVVEAGLDVFEIVEMGTIGLEEQVAVTGFSLWPNPTDGTFTVRTATTDHALLEVFDAVGRSVMDPVQVRNGSVAVELNVPAGAYVVRLTGTDGFRSAQSLVVSGR